MLLSINWLKDYLQKADLKIDPRELAEKLTMRGLAVAAIKRPGASLESVIVGRIEKIEKHPNADRLQVTRVVTSEAEGAQRLQIVCGAKNIAEGDMVPVALPGTILPGDFEIKLSTIRGVESYGMICSGKELGISDDDAGILQLPKHSQIGVPLTRLLGGGGGSDDTLLEFELTPNRADCLSVIGLAREICPILKTKLREQKPARFRVTPHRTSSIIRVEVDDANLCPRYVARAIDTLKVTESPDWIKQRLQTVGMKPVNNIVDVTNFVMMELGQPLHAFDLRKIQSGTIRVAPCKAPMDFTLLNGETVQLVEGDILILDDERPIALAGIMGGQNSQIEPDTTSIILESAAFFAPQIRRTAKRLGLLTESSRRFEKGSDLAAVGAASERAAGLLRDSFNANVYHPPIDTNEFGVKEQLLSINMRDVRKATGLTDMSAEVAAELLDTIGIPSLRKSVNVLSVRLPTFRYDLKESVDLVEEIARLYGYDKIPQNLPISVATYEGLDETQIEFESAVRNLLCGAGLRETIHYSFTSESNLQRFGYNPSEAIHLKNPITEDMKVMRTSLLPSLLQTYQFNKNRKIADQKLFEIAHTYAHDNNEETKTRETCRVAVLLSGNITAPHWKGKTPEVDFYHMKGLADLIVRQMTTVYLAYDENRSHRLLHPNRSAHLKLGFKDVGVIGEIHPYVRQHVLKTEDAIILLEMDLDVLKKYEKGTIRYKAPSKFPPIELDLALLVDAQTPSGFLGETIKQMGGTLLYDVALFDLYEGKNIPEGKKSVAFHLTFLSPDRTLQEEEIVVLKERIVQALLEKHGAKLRT